MTLSFSDAENYLIEKDPLLGAIITDNGPIQHERRGHYFEALSRAIIGQQISVKAAAKIFERFSVHTALLPERVLAIDDECQKVIGLSGQKMRYLQDLALHFVNDSAVFNHLKSLDDDSAIIELTRVKGIGVWTAQMFLMFTLSRDDIFAPDDRGLQLAVQRLYALPTVPTRSELVSYSEQWRPYRSTASYHLWRSLDNEPTGQKARS